jgi:hypothetical protein
MRLLASLIVLISIVDMIYSYQMPLRLRNSNSIRSSLYMSATKDDIKLNPRDERRRILKSPN